MASFFLRNRENYFIDVSKLRIEIHVFSIASVHTYGSGQLKGGRLRANVTEKSFTKSVVRIRKKASAGRELFLLLKQARYWETKCGITRNLSKCRQACSFGENKNRWTWAITLFVLFILLCPAKTHNLSVFLSLLLIRIKLLVWTHIFWRWTTGATVTPVCTRFEQSSAAVGRVLGNKLQLVVMHWCMHWCIAGKQCLHDRFSTQTIQTGFNRCRRFAEVIVSMPVVKARDQALPELTFLMLFCVLVSWNKKKTNTSVYRWVPLYSSNWNRVKQVRISRIL